MAKNSNKDYFKLSRILSIILAIIPVTSWILGSVTRFKEGHIICGLVRLLFGWNVIWIADIILMILQGHILKIF